MRKLPVISGAIILMSLNGCHLYNKKHISYLQIVDDKGKSRIKEDDFIVANYTVKTTFGEVVYDNYDHTFFEGKPDFQGDLFDGLSMLGEGDSAIVKVSIDSLNLKKKSLPANATGKYLVYYIRINKVITRIGHPNHTSDSILNADIEACKMANIENAKKKEEGLLKHYITINKLTPGVTSSGLNYVIERMGGGPKPTEGDLSQIYFTGRYADGEVFFTNNKIAALQAGIYQTGKNYDPLEMYIGKKLFIRGLEEGLMLMPQGTKARLIIPSKLSNGERYGYVPLICEIEVLNIRHPKPGEKIKMLHNDDDEEKKNINLTYDN